MQSSDLIDFIRDQYGTNKAIPLHAPSFTGNEIKYVTDTIESTFVSSVGSFVNRFEQDIASYTNSPNAIATVNGTAALHVALILAGVKANNLVITQALTFVATCNAISYTGAEPVFIDVERATLGISPAAMENWLDENAHMDTDGQCRRKSDQRKIRACVPMHTFGHPVDMDGLLKVCSRWNLPIVEDAAESLGSFYKNRHTGTIGDFGTISFNGNKIITTGGGGMILTDNSSAQQAKHLTTTAKLPHPYEYTHNEIGYNYRLPNLNAALGCSQLEQLESFIQSKRTLARNYSDFLKGSSLEFIEEPKNCRSNYWLNAVLCEDFETREAVLKATNSVGVMTRPIWDLMCSLPMYRTCSRGELPNSEWLQKRLVNLPSSPPPKQ